MFSQLLFSKSMRMKSILVLFPFLFMGTIAFSQSECEVFKTGKFKTIKNGITKSTIERTDSTQTELEDDRELKQKIEWIDGCSYRLIFIEGNDAWWDERGKRPTPDILVRITDIEESSYVQEAKFDDEDALVHKTLVLKLE